jgi:pyridoxine 5-phosphate synthase
MLVKLGVNIDHVATLREARKGNEPEVALAALVCEKNGADSIVAHLREDRRHIKEQDLYILKTIISTKLNLEMSINPRIVEIACHLKPDQSTLVPEKREELTTEGGLDVMANSKQTMQATKKLEASHIAVSLFIDPNKKQIRAARDIGIKRIELHTGRYAQAKNKKEQEKSLQEIKQAAIYAKAQGFTVFAGHGLDYANVSRIAQISQIEELNIGYSIICRAVFVGLGKAVREMRALIKR